MQAQKIRNGMRLADSLAGLLRTTALTLGPPLLKLSGDEREGKRFTGLVKEPDRVFNPEAEHVSKVHPFGTAISYICAQCNSPDVRIEAFAEWDEDNQNWKCQSTFVRNAECQRCGPTHIMPRPMSKPHAKTVNA